MPGDERVKPHQRNVRSAADADMMQLGLFKIAHHPETVRIDNGDLGLSRRGIVAGAKPKMRDVAGNRCAHRRMG